MTTKGAADSHEAKGKRDKDPGCPKSRQPDQLEGKTGRQNLNQNCNEIQIH
jgi:hypothetical protein